MKKAFKILGIILLAIVVILLLVGFIINSSDIPSYDVEKIDFESKSSPEALARGEKLVTLLCASCHLNEETRKLTGMLMEDVPAEFGEIYSPNITQDKKFGIGEWTDGEILYLLRTGIKRDGQYAPPYMAKLPLMADEDINAIIAFLRSDNTMVQAAAVEDQKCKPSFLAKMLCRVAFKPFPMPTAPIAMPDTLDTKAHGEYLAHNLDCFSCHSNDFKTVNFLDPKLSEGYFAGGNEMMDREGRKMVTPNITPSKATGIGNWSKESFIRAVKYGVIEGESSLSFPMIPYNILTDNEAAAIYDYLQTIPPIEHKVERTVYDD